MSKFANLRAEAAYVIANHGFAEEESGSVEEADGWKEFAPGADQPPLTASYTNANPNSPTSTVSRRPG